LVLKSELNFAGPVTRVAYESYDTYAAGYFYEFEMRLCHTPLAALTTNFSANYGGHTPTLVATLNPLTVNARKDEWFGVACTTPFAYNNRDNLIVEVRWRNPSLTTKVEVWGYVATSNRLLIHKEYGATEGQLSPKTDRLRITFSGAPVTPTSLGRIKMLLR
jgi:hypothetical protein